MKTLSQIKIVTNVTTMFLLSYNIKENNFDS